MNIELTNAFKDIIVSNGLIDTGNLFRSISVDIYQEYTDIIVDVNGLDYIKYLYDDYSLSMQFSSTNIFQSVVGDLMYEITSEYINDLLNGDVSTIDIDDINVYIKYNGV